MKVGKCLSTVLLTETNAYKCNSSDTTKGIYLCCKKAQDLLYAIYDDNLDYLEPAMVCKGNYHRCDY